MTSVGTQYYTIEIKDASRLYELRELAINFANQEGFKKSNSTDRDENPLSLNHFRASAWLEINMIEENIIVISWHQLRGGCSSNIGVPYSKEPMGRFFESLKTKMTVLSTLESLDASQ